MIPIAGSAYTYSYATLGELMAWIIGWDLVLEYGIGAATVGIAWSEYLNKLLEFLPGHHTIPYAWCHSPFESMPTRGVAHGIMNVPALFIILMLTLLLIRGMKESAFVNGIIVVTKVTIVILIIVFGWGFISPANHTPYIPDADDDQGRAGRRRTTTAASSASSAPPASSSSPSSASTRSRRRRRRRSIPSATCRSASSARSSICTVLYILFAHVLTGIASVEDFRTSGREASVAYAITQHMPGYGWLAKLVTVAILFGFTSVILVMLMGQSRVFFSMSRDGLVPKVFSRRAPEVPHAVQVEPAFLRLRRRLRGVRPGRHRRRHDVDRHAVRVRARVHRRLGAARARPERAAPVQDAAGAARADPRRHRQPR